MRFSLSNISIKNRFNIFLFTFIIATLVVIFSFGMAINNVKEYRDYNRKIDMLVIDYLNLRRYEQQFLLRYSEDRLFFSSGENKYYNKLILTAGDFKELVKELESDEISEKIAVKEDYSQILIDQEQYEQIILNIKEKLKKRGSENIGIIGNMNEDIASLYDNEKNIFLIEYLDELRKNSRDYLYYQDMKYYKTFLDNYSMLYDFIASGLSPEKRFNTYRVNNIADTIRQNDTIQKNNNLKISSGFVNNINNFKYNFTNLVDLDKEIGLTYLVEGSLKGELKEETKQYGVVEQIKEKVEIEQKSTVEQMINYIYIFFAIVISGLFFIIIRFSKSITEPILKLKEYMKPLSMGSLPAKLPEITGNDELSEMTSSVNELILGLRKTTEFATNIGRGHFDDDFQPLSDNDVLGNSLIEMRENLNNAKIEEDKRKHDDSLRKWANEGLAKFNEILRQSTENIEGLANIVIKELIYFLKANQGGLFIFNDRDKDDIHLELIAAYAYDKERKKKKKIYLGEGLVGTAAVEKETIYMTEIPDTYITISSGLGGSNPTSLLIVPLRVEQEIFGIVEIASFNKFEKYEIEFVEKVSESIAASLSITKINTRTAELLRKSQLQTEEMAFQEMEMRKNFDELRIAQEESARREAEMAGILNAIDKSSLVIELDIKGYITSINKALLDLFDLPYDNLTGQHHSEFFRPKDDVEYTNFWKELKDGNNVQRVEHIIIDQNEFWLSFTYAPIKDDLGKMVKILSMGVDLTESKKLESELLEQAEQMHAQEEEMRQNLDVLQKTQDEMSLKQIQLQEANRNSKANEEVLAVAIEKSKIQQEELAKSNLELEKREQLLQEKLEQVRNAQIRYLEEHSKLQELNHKLKENEQNLREALEKSQEQEHVINKRNQQLIAGEEELRQNIEELKSTREQLQEQHENIIKVNEDLAQKEAEIRSRFETVDKNNLVAEYNLNGTIETANESFLETFGYSREEIYGKHHRMFLPDSERRDKNYIAFWNGLRKGISYENEYLRVSKLNEPIYFRGIYNPIRDPEGKPYKILEILTNITGRKLAEAQLKSRMESIESATATIEISYSGKILHANDIFLNSLGYTAEDLEEKKHEDIMEKNYADSHLYHQLWIDLKRGSLKSGEFPHISKENTVKVMRGTFSGVRTADGKTDKFIFIGFDITDIIEHRNIVSAVEEKMNSKIADLEHELASKLKEIDELKNK